MKLQSTGHLSRQIGEDIRRIRLSHDMTQKQLAAAIGVSYQQIQRYELGTSGLVVERLAMIAGVFNMSAADLLRTPAQIATTEKSIAIDPEATCLLDEEKQILHAQH